MRGTIGAALLALALTGCGGGTQSPPQTPTSGPTSSLTSQPSSPRAPTTEEALACKLAMVKQFQEALNSSETGSRPEECNGIDDVTIQKYAEEILTEALDDETTTTTP